MSIFNIIRDSQINSLEPADIDCSGCSGKCCQMPWNVEITSEEAKRFDNREVYGRFYLSKKEDTNFCTYQSKDGRCSIWENRPKVCAQFDCRTDGRQVPDSKYTK